MARRLSELSVLSVRTRRHMKGREFMATSVTQIPAEGQLLPFDAQNSPLNAQKSPSWCLDDPAAA